ncbi:MAG: hypothetical protein QM582_18305 [Micropruina sp.]|uniref:hypothetical protein n=1 Tax=Micropruina sp. TaxID=2737536 RepID=UPI0039E54C60
MSPKTEQGGASKGAGLYDIRNFIGLLLLIYGLILAGMGLFADPELDKTGGVNANLITGLCLLVAGGVFMLWARLKPVAVESSAAAPQSPSGH